MIVSDTALHAFDEIAIDSVGPLKITPRGNKHILTVQDNLTRYCIAVAVPDIKAVTIVDALARHVIAIVGAAQVIISDQDITREFTNQQISAPMN